MKAAHVCERDTKQLRPDCFSRVLGQQREKQQKTAKPRDTKPAYLTSWGMFWCVPELQWKPVVSFYCLKQFCTQFIYSDLLVVLPPWRWQSLTAQHLTGWACSVCNRSLSRFGVRGTPTDLGPDSHSHWSFFTLLCRHKECRSSPASSSTGWRKHLGITLLWLKSLGIQKGWLDKDWVDFHIASGFREYKSTAFSPLFITSSPAPDTGIE